MINTYVLPTNQNIIQAENPKIGELFVLITEDYSPTPTTKGIISITTTVAAIGSFIIRDHHSKQGNVMSVYISNFATANLKPQVASLPIFSRLALYPLVLGSAFALSSTSVLGKQIFPFLSGMTVKFASNDVGKYLARANKVQELEDDDDSDDDEPNTSSQWLFSRNGNFGNVEVKIETTLQPYLDLIQNEKNIPYLYVRVGITAAAILSALTTNLLAPGSFASYSMMNLLRKVLKPLIMPTPLVPRFATHAMGLGIAGFCDYSGLVSLPAKIFPFVCDFSFSFLTVDAKKGMKGTFQDNAWCYTGDCLSEVKEPINDEDEAEVESSDHKKEKEPPSPWKQTTMVVSTFGIAMLTHHYLPLSLTPILATDLFCGSIKAVIKRVPIVPRYALLTGSAVAGQCIQVYTNLPTGTIAISLTAKSIFSDVRKWTIGKKLAPLLPTSWNPLTWFCPPSKDKSKKFPIEDELDEMDEMDEMDEHVKELEDFDEDFHYSVLDYNEDKGLLTVFTK